MNIKEFLFTKKVSELKMICKESGIIGVSKLNKAGLVEIMSECELANLTEWYGMKPIIELSDIGGYSGAKPKKTGLTRWHKEDWKTQDGKTTYNGKKNKIFRPTKRITKDTPTTMGELSSKRKKKAIAEKKAKGRVKKY